MYSDPTAHTPFFIVCALVFGAACAIAGGAIARYRDNNVLAGIGIGFTVGILAGAGFGLMMGSFFGGSAMASFASIKGVYIGAKIGLKTAIPLIDK